MTMEFTIEEMQVLLRGLEHRHSLDVDSLPPLTDKEALIAANLHIRFMQEIQDQLHDEKHQQ